MRAVRPYTMTSDERLFALIEAVRFITRSKVPGAIVECGVWRGGSMMAAARTLLSLGDTSRELYLFDTFAGMTDPGAEDVTVTGEAAGDYFRENWCYSPLEAVREAVLGVGYDGQKIHFVRGDVEDTIPDQAPEEIALLRLDTDWYASTRHEMVHLFPRLASGGVLIVDDYGHWQGARQAVDEYLAERDTPLLLARIDYSGRIALKS